jgi:hypothetical protein
MRADREGVTVKLTVDKLGRIEHAEIELGKLTVFLGENGTNKTWVAYALHGLLTLGSRSAMDAKRYTTKRPADPRNTARLERLWAEAQQTDGDVVTSLTHENPGYVGGVLGSKGLENILGVTASVLDQAVEVDFRADPEQFSSLLRSARVSLRNRGALVSVEGLLADGRTIERRWTNLADADALNQELSHFGGAYVDRCAVFPAERKALSALRMDRDSQIRSLPIADYLGMLDDARTRSKPSVFDASRSHFHAILGGNLVYAGPPEALRQVFLLKGGKEVPLHAAHSLVRAVAGLAAYLEKLAQPGDFVIIDELEMNAHPKAQLALTEFIALLVNKGLRVVFTTHSPYIVDHLNNLLEASQVPAERQEALAQKFQLKTAEAFLKPEDVRVHWFKPASDDPSSPVEVVPVLKDGLIDAETFSFWTNWETSLFNVVLNAEESR